MTLKILFVGGTGFIGKTFVEHIAGLAADPGVTLTVTSRDPDTFARNNAGLVARFRDRVAVVRQTLPGLTPCGSYDVIVHGAETPSASFADGELAESVAAMDDLLRFAAAAEARRIVYLSSGAVYRVDGRLAPPFDAAADLKDRRGERDLYARAKSLNEQALRAVAARSGIEHAIIRIFNVASAHVPLSGRFALGNFVRDMLDPEIAAIDIHGSGRDLRSFIGGNALARLILHAATAAPDGAVYNACGTQTLSVLDLAELVRDVTGIAKPITVHAPDAAVNDYTGLPNLPAACLSTPQDVRDAIADLVAAARDQRQSLGAPELRHA